MNISSSSSLLLSSPACSHYKTITPSQYLSLFLLFDDHPRRRGEICKENNVSRSTIYPHYKKWKDAGRPTNTDHLVFQNERWKSRRVVDPTIEEGVAAFLRDLDANNIPFSYDIIRDLMRESHIIHLDNHHSHLRSNLQYYKEKNFKFSDKYIRRFCIEYHFKGAVLKVKKKPKAKSLNEQQIEKALIKEYKEKLNAAINKYGAAIPDRVRTLVSETSKNKSITMNGEPRAIITANLSITASGEKLGTHIIANNPETADMVENDNNGNDFFDWSASGRMTWVNMIDYIDNIYNPYINSLPPSTLPPFKEKKINFRLCNRVRSSVVHRDEKNPLPQSALVLDVYGSHVEQAHFKKYAKENHIELIYVPPGHTDALQPLDIGINAIMKNKRIKYVKDKLKEDAFTHFDKRDAVINTQRAIDEIQSSTIINTFNIAIENAKKMSDE